MTARFTSIDGAIINDPIIASLKQTYCSEWSNKNISNYN